MARRRTGWRSLPASRLHDGGRMYADHIVEPETVDHRSIQRMASAYVPVTTSKDDKSEGRADRPDGLADVATGPNRDRAAERLKAHCNAEIERIEEIDCMA